MSSLACQAPIFSVKFFIMQAVVNQDFLSVEDYLAGEEAGEIKHEYIAGTVYAMAGGTSDHHQIGLNIAFAARSHLKGKPCKVFVFDFKLRLKISEGDVFYYPDVMVGCDPRDTHTLYLRFPKLLVEISSESTERLDRCEKKLAYQTIETIEEYLIVAQDRYEVILYRRDNDWQPELFSRLSDSVTLKAIELDLPLFSIYEGLALGAVA